MSSSKIKDLFTTGSKDAIEHYAKTTKDFSSEIQAFKTLCTDPNYDRALLVFYVELLSRAIKKPADLDGFISVLLPFIDTATIMKTSVVVLRTLRALCTIKAFIPLSFYLVKLMAVAMNMKNVKRTGKHFTYDEVKISTEEASSEELQIFVIRESIQLLKRHLRAHGSSIAFPELATVVCGELRIQGKGVYKEIVGDLIKYIQKRKTYVEEERKKAELRADELARVSEFEKALAPWGD